MRQQLLKALLRGLRRASIFLFLVTLAVALWQALTHPKSPLPPEWNPIKPLHISDPFSPLTEWKLEAALSTPEACRAALATGASFTPMPDFEESALCHIRNRVKLSAIGQAKLTPVETTCETALRLALWAHHGVQPAAERLLGTKATRIRHFSSYNCRQMRTTRGNENRMSSHATAMSIDISGFNTKDGVIDLKKDWTSNSPKAAFLREVNEAACMWFRVTLGPSYNRLHADHYHLQSTGWGLCR